MAVTFDFKKRLGSGYFGEVWHVVDTGLGCEVALKCIPPDKIINPQNFFQEAQALKLSEHPNIVRVNETGNLDDGRVYVSMEYLPRGSLEDETQGAPMPLTRAKRLMIDTLRGLGHAHLKAVVHRDVKPANILIGNAGEAKLSDFGLAVPDIKNMNIAQLKQYQYMLHLAPEVRQPQDYTYLSDIYAAGITLYRLINGDSHLPAISPQQAQRLAKRGEFPPRDKYREYVPQSLRRLINKAMSVDPTNRFQSADEMRHALEHQKLMVDWSEATLPNRQIWTGISQDGINYRVLKLHTNRNGWQIQTQRGKAELRRVTALCGDNLRKEDADKRARRILQDLVTGKV